MFIQEMSSCQGLLFTYPDEREQLINRYNIKGKKRHERDVQRLPIILKFYLDLRKMIFGEKTMLSVVVNINNPHMVGNSFLDGKH